MCIVIKLLGKYTTPIYVTPSHVNMRIQPRFILIGRNLGIFTIRGTISDSQCSVRFQASIFTSKICFATPLLYLHIVKILYHVLSSKRIKWHQKTQHTRKGDWDNQRHFVFLSLLFLSVEFSGASFATI